jgi:L-threonylcarbamoyladenylate synthase
MFKQDLDQALAVLKSGGIILYPTDTVWGLGCDATNELAVEKINQIKGRTADKSFIILLDTDSKIPSYVTEVPEVAYDLIEYAENPLTIVFSNAKNLAKNVINQDGTIGIRVVKHDFCGALLQRFRKPIVSTSANLSGQPTPQFFDEISEEIKDKVDYVISLEQESRSPKKPSTIIKLGPTGQFSFIRK